MSEPETGNPPAPAAIDPVCGMKVDPATARHEFQHDSDTYYFCCDVCRKIPIAAGALYPALGLMLSAMIARAAMSASLVSVVTNALRLRKLRL